MGKSKTYKILTLLLFMQWAFMQLIAQYPAFIEHYYSNGLYPIVSKFLRIIFGWIPFSFGDVLYTFLVVLIIYHFIKAIKSKTLFSWLFVFKVGALLSVLFFLFNLNWGLNYHRTKLHERLQISTDHYTDDELFEFTKLLVSKTNAIHFEITKNDSAIVKNPIQKNEMEAIAHKAYKKLENSYPSFNYDFPAAKRSIFSLPLTYMGFAGYLNPITNEAQVNYMLPINSYPATLCHEIAHQTGIASENEANFVGYLASTHSDNIYFNYSGYLMATRYCLAELYRKDADKFKEVSKNLHVGIKKDIQQNMDFWKKYQNWSEQLFKAFYDSYLKANKQKDGIKGYSKMVTLLINYYKTTNI